LRNLYWASNFEETRWFLAIQLQRPEGDELNKLLAVCNGTVEDYLQPPLYATPRSTCQQSPKANGRPRKYGRTNMSASSSNEEILDFSTLFHISIGWALERPSSSVMDHTNSLINNEGFESLRNVPVKVDTLKMKIGNIITSISLAPKAAEGKSIFGA
jgi:U6 snRNA phosphodiesterase